MAINSIIDLLYTWKIKRKKRVLKSNTTTKYIFPVQSSDFYEGLISSFRSKRSQLFNLNFFFFSTTSRFDSLIKSPISAYRVKWIGNESRLKSKRRSLLCSIISSALILSINGFSQLYTKEVKCHGEWERKFFFTSHRKSSSFIFPFPVNRSKMKNKKRKRVTRKFFCRIIAQKKSYNYHGGRPAIIHLVYRGSSCGERRVWSIVINLEAMCGTYGRPKKVRRRLTWKKTISVLVGYTFGKRA